MRSTITLLATLALIPAGLPAQGWIIPRPCDAPGCAPPPHCGTPGCRLPRVPTAAGIERLRSEVRVELANRVLRYEIEETFVNRGGRVGEADYLFPLPKGAAFQDLKLSIDGELVAGETMDAARARRIYEEIVRQQRDPALVEWMGYGLLRTRIFPIAPGEEKKIVVRFQMVAEREGDAVRVDYFGFGTRAAGDGTRARDNDPRLRTPDGRLHFTLSYAPGDGYGTPYSPTHALDIATDRGRRRVEARGESRELTILLPVRRAARSEPSITLLAHHPGRDEGFALITLSPPDLRGLDARRDVTLVIDVSGSMSGTKIEQARAAGKQVLATLGPRDRFRIIDFATDVRTFRDDFVVATGENLADARDYLDDLDASGSTNISGALEEALRHAPAAGRLPLVLFITDGEPTVGERRPEMIAAQASKLRGRSRVFTFGLGADVNVSLVEQLALEGRGTAHFVRPEESVERAVSVVAQRLTSPVLTDVRVRAEGVRLTRLHPALPADVFAGQDLVLFARYDGSGDARLRVEAETSDGPATWLADIELPDRERDNAFVPRLWATQRLGWLSAEKRKHGASEEIDREIRELGERYGIPTEFTSYFVPEPGLIVADMDLAGRRQAGSGRGVAAGVAGGVGRAVPAAAPSAESARVRRFEAAKAATAQRSATSLAAADSVAMAGADGTSRAGLRRAGSRMFQLRDSIWVDARHQPGTRVIQVRAFSEAYFEVAALDPELRAALAVGERVIVGGRGISVEVGPTGADRLSAADRGAIQAAF